MGLTTYVMLIFGISIALYFCGYTPMLFAVLQCPTGATACATSGNFAPGILNTILSLMTNPLFLITIGVGFFTPFLSGANFSVMYIIPAVIFMAVMNFLVLPTSFLLSASVPTIVSIIILGFLNLLLMITMITFIRGGE